MAHPITKFKPERVKAILDDIKRGVPYVIAAEKNGIHESTFRDWRKNGRRDLLAQVESDYATLVRSLREIEAQRISASLVDIRGSEKGHRGKEWELERSFWRYFSSKAVEIEVNERLDNLEEKKEKSYASPTQRNEETTEACEKSSNDAQPGKAEVSDDKLPSS